MKNMTRHQVKSALRRSVKRKAAEEGWSNERTEREMERALADTDWVLEMQRQIQNKRN